MGRCDQPKRCHCDKRRPDLVLVPDLPSPDGVLTLTNTTDTYVLYFIDLFQTLKCNRELVVKVTEITGVTLTVNLQQGEETPRAVDITEPGKHVIPLQKNDKVAFSQTSNLVPDHVLNFKALVRKVCNH